MPNSIKVLFHIILFNTHNIPFSWVLRLRVSGLSKVTKPVRGKGRSSNLGQSDSKALELDSRI